MAAIDDLTAAVSTLQTDVTALIAKPPVGVTDAQIQAVTNNVVAIDAQVKAALGS